MLKSSSLVLVVLSALAAAGCESPRTADARKRIEPVYDPRTGRLQLLKYDADGDGTVDTWSHMDGARVVRIEIDKNQDGKIDRWEDYGADQKLQQVGVSRRDSGKPDVWSHTSQDSSIARVDLFSADGRMTRTEYYENTRLVRAVEDVDGDGQVDKWEAYDGVRLSSVAFATTRRGIADRRLVYGADGSARLEADAAGDGRFVAVRPPVIANPLPVRR